MILIPVRRFTFHIDPFNRSCYRRAGDGKLPSHVTYLVKSGSETDSEAWRIKSDYFIRFFAIYPRRIHPDSGRSYWHTNPTSPKPRRDPVFPFISRFKSAAYHWAGTYSTRLSLTSIIKRCPSYVLSIWAQRWFRTSSSLLWRSFFVPSLPLYLLSKRQRFPYFLEVPGQDLRTVRLRVQQKYHGV